MGTLFVGQPITTNLLKVKPQVSSNKHHLVSTVPNDHISQSFPELMSDLNFERVLIRVFEFQTDVGPQLFELEIIKMEQRLEQAQKLVLDSQLELIGKEFSTYWLTTSNDSRIEMIEKCCQWLALMRGSEWCGIEANEWVHQHKLYMELSCELVERTDIVMEMHKGGNNTYCMLDDEKFVYDAITSYSISTIENTPLVIALSTFKRFVSHFIVNSLIVMYKALRHANLVTAPTLPQEEKKAHHVKKMKKRIIITPEEEQVPFDDISRLKVEGNTYYRNGHFEEAVRAYTVALALLPNNFDERAILHANRAAAFLKLRAYERVIEETTHCLASEPKHAKSLFRRAFANEMLQNYQLAIVDYETAYRFNPGSQDIQEALERVRVSMKGFQGS